MVKFAFFLVRSQKLSCLALAGSVRCTCKQAWLNERGAPNPSPCVAGRAVSSDGSGFAAVVATHQASGLWRGSRWCVLTHTTQLTDANGMPLVATFLCIQR